jgi:hypothetical protein
VVAANKSHLVGLVIPHSEAHRKEIMAVLPPPYIPLEVVEGLGALVKTAQLQI